MLLTSGIYELAAVQPLKLTAGNTYDGPLATFKSDVALAADFVSRIEWGYGATWDEDLETLGMVKQTGDHYTVYGMHTYIAPGSTSFRAHVYDVDENMPVHYEVIGQISVSDGIESFEHETVRPLPLNLQSTEGASFSETVMQFADSNLNRGLVDYSATILGGSCLVAGSGCHAGTISQDAPGLFSVRPSAAMLFSSESATTITVQVDTIDGESVVGESSMLVLGAPLHVVGRTIPTPYDTLGDPVLTFYDIVATFTDENPYSHPNDFEVFLDWGDGEQDWLTNASDKLEIVKLQGGTYEIWSGRTYDKDGSYDINVRVFEDRHSRANAVSNITLLPPPPTDLDGAWSAIDCNHEYYGIGDGPTVEYTVTETTLRDMGGTLAVERGQSVSVASVVGSINYAADETHITIDWVTGRHYSSKTSPRPHQPAAIRTPKTAHISSTS